MTGISRRQILRSVGGVTGQFVMTIPPTPYRCPPGPYERACVVADFLKREKRGGHVVVLDANTDIVAERAILRAFDGVAPDPAPVTNSACFSPITYNTASWLTASFRYDPGTATMQLVPESFGEARRPSRENFEDMFAWSDNLFADTFG